MDLERGTNPGADPIPTPLARNDPRQYDMLADAWWDPTGPLAMLQWLAEARAELIPPAPPGAVPILLDLGCGGGLLAPAVSRKGYRHFGADLNMAALERASDRGVGAVKANVSLLPFPDGCADVVCAGEILEHVIDLDTTLSEACRVLKPGGTLIVDTIANTALARFAAVTVAERIPGFVPRGIHDPSLFVDRRRLVDVCRRKGVHLRLSGLRPHIRDTISWLARRRTAVRMVPTRSTAILFSGWGIKELT